MRYPRIPLPRTVSGTPLQGRPPPDIPEAVHPPPYNFFVSLLSRLHMRYAYTMSYSSSRAAFYGGLKDSLKAPGLIMGASMVGYGSLAFETGWSIEAAFASVVFIWALPGQIAMVEMWGTGSSLFAIALAVGLINARLLPLVVTLFPVVRNTHAPKWHYYAIAHLIAMTSWVFTMRRAIEIDQTFRLSFLLGMGGGLYILSCIAVPVGYYLTQSVPPALSLGLVFLNPLYFMLVFCNDFSERGRVLALLFGAILGPTLFLWSPDWSLLIAGLTAGTLAFVLRGKRHD